MTPRSKTTLAALMFAFAAVAACTQSQPPEATAAAGSHEAESSAHHAPGPEPMMFAALHHLDLSADQKATIHNAMQTLAPSEPGEHAQLLANVVAGVRAGHIDEAAIVAKLDGPSANHTTALAGVIATVHDTLTAEQRRALVETIKQHIGEHEAEQPDAIAGPNGMLQHLLATLDLTREQRVTIDAILASSGAQPSTQDAMTAFHAALAARLQTFTNDHFDATAFATTVSNAQPMVRDHMQSALHLLAAIVPVLDPAQREALAGKIEAMVAHGH